MKLPFKSRIYQLFCIFTVVLATLFSMGFCGSSSASQLNEIPTYYYSKNAVTKAPNDVGCVEIAVPGTNKDGTSANVKMLYYRIPPNLNPDRLTNEQLSSCGLMTRPADGFKSVESYKKWFSRTKKLIDTPVAIPPMLIGHQGVCVGDPTLPCKNSAKIKQLNEVLPPNANNGYTEISSPNFSGRIIQNTPSPYVQSVSLTTGIVIPVARVKPGSHPGYGAYSTQPDP